MVDDYLDATSDVDKLGKNPERSPERKSDLLLCMEKKNYYISLIQPKKKSIEYRLSLNYLMNLIF